MKEITVLGIGGSTFARIDLAKACGYAIAGLYHYNDERTGQVDHGYPILGSFDNLFSQQIEGKHFLLTMGDMKIRYDLYNRITLAGGIVPTLIHPSAEISEFAVISPEGAIIDSQAIIQSDCVISEGVFVCSQAMICHQTTIGRYVFVAPKAIIGARLNIGEFAFIGQNATIISTKVKKIGSHSTIGAGAVVTKQVKDNKIMIGNPARIMETNKIIKFTGGGNSLLYNRLWLYGCVKGRIAA